MSLANHGCWALLESCNPFIGRSHSLPHAVTLRAPLSFTVTCSELQIPRVINEVCSCLSIEQELAQNWVDE